jgi:hypothetical protein
VVKKAIINAYVNGDYYKSIHDSTRVVIFFGTPHRGGHLATLSDHMARVCRVVSGNVRNNIMETLRRDSMFAGYINKDFARRAQALEMRLLNFIENLPIDRYIGLVSVLFGASVVCPRPMESQFLVGIGCLFVQAVPSSSATLDWSEPAETQVRLQVTHTAICKFSEKNEMYKVTEDNLCELLSWPSSNTIASLERVQ